MSKTSLKNNSSSNAFRITHTYLSPKFQNERRFSGSNSLDPLVLGADSRDSSKDLIKRSELQKESKHNEYIPVYDGNTALKDLSNLRKIVETKIFADSKNIGNTSPTKKNIALRVSSAKLFNTLDCLSGNEVIDQDQSAGKNWVRDKGVEPNELKTMDQVITQFKKVSRENLIISLESGKIRRSKLKPTHFKIPAHIKNATALTKQVFHGGEPQLNNIILKKLSLDPKTKERQASHFVAALERDFPKNIELRKQSEKNVFNSRFMSMRFGKIIPSNLFTPSEQSRNSEKTHNLFMEKPRNPGKGGPRILVGSELDENEIRSTGKLNRVDEKSGICATSSDNLTLIQIHTKIIDNGVEKIIKALSFPKIESENEFLAECFGTPISNISLHKEASSQIIEELGCEAKIDPSPKESFTAVTEKDVVAMKELMSRMHETLKKDKSREASLIQENQRLTQEILSLKAKLKFYEDKCPQLASPTEHN